jgi:hypothetical protein
VFLVHRSSAWRAHKNRDLTYTERQRLAAMGGTSRPPAPWAGRLTRAAPTGSRRPLRRPVGAWQRAGPGQPRAMAMVGRICGPVPMQPGAREAPRQISGGPRCDGGSSSLGSAGSTRPRRRDQRQRRHVGRDRDSWLPSAPVPMHPRCL